MEVFSECFYNATGLPYENADAAFVLSYSGFLSFLLSFFSFLSFSDTNTRPVIMLNVDAHNENVKKKMTFEQFQDSNKGINGDDQKVSPLFPFFFPSSFLFLFLHFSTKPLPGYP